MSRKTFSYVFTRVCVLAAGILVLCAPSVYAAAELYIGAGGTIEQSAGEIILTGDWNNAGAFTQTSGTVTFEGGGVSALTGNTTFVYLQCVTASKTLTFPAGSTQTVTGLCTMNGQAAETKITLRSSSTGTKWYFKTTNSTQTLSYVSVTDAYASSNVVICSNSTDGGTNYRWLFGAAGPSTWISPASSTTTMKGYTLSRTPKFWCTTPSRDIAFSDAQIAFSTVTNFASNVTTYTYTTTSTGWTGWSGGTIQPLAYSTYTVQAGSELTVEATYYVRVRFYDGYFWSEWATDTRKVLVTSTNWTNDTLTAGETPIRAAHFTELKNHISNVRQFRGLSAGSWDSSWDTLTAGTTPIKAVHLTDLRTNLDEALTRVGVSYSWTDAITAGTTPVRKTHIDELRAECKIP